MRDEKKGVTVNNNNIDLKRSEKKQILRHSVHVAVILDKLMQMESDPEKLQYLKTLRKENARIWPRLRA